MTRLLIAPFVLALVSVPAGAAPMEVTGHPCRYLSVRSEDAGAWTGVLYATPQKLSHIAGNPLVSGSLRCTLKVRTVWESRTHLDPGVASTQGPVTPAAAVAPPVPISYPAGEWAVSVCAQVDVVGEGPYYWDDFAPGRWTTDPGVTCTDTTSIYVPPPYLQRIYGMVESAFGTTDELVCAELTALAPGVGPVTIEPGGDTYVDGEFVWDCPPYMT